MSQETQKIEEAPTESWELEDAEKLARAFPYTFWKPSPTLLDMLQAGDHAKLIFKLKQPGPDDPNAERMWVEITERTENSFVGQLESDPGSIADLQRGAEIHFGHNHIIDSNVEDPVPDPTLKWRAQCFVTNRILVDRNYVGYLYREAPRAEADSGWRFFFGDEDDAYMANPENSQYVTLGALLTCDDRVLPLLDHAAPIAFHWDQQFEQFNQTDVPQTT